ncbi:hypothetical protein ND747_21925 [Frankia sp. R82]|nr:hypothetical protein [Frankia sp. R82]
MGHRTNLDDACQRILDLCPRSRLPETTHAADLLSRITLATHRGTTQPGRNAEPAP